MLSKKMNRLLNQQMNNEFFAGYTYLAIVAYFDREELFGFSSFFRVQAEEELTHAMKIFDYISKAGGEAALDSIQAPKASYKSPEEAFVIGLENEKRVTKDINKLMDEAMAESDHATRVLLNWFVTEQLEEETLFSTYRKRVQMVKGDGKGILLLDEQLSRRGADLPEKNDE
jgi:ferritin